MASQPIKSYGKNKVAEAFLEIFSVVKTFNSSLYYPKQSYNAAFNINFASQPFVYVLESLIARIAENSQLTRNLKSLHGNNWDQGVRQAFVNELYMVIQFIEFAKSTPQQLSTEMYKSFIHYELTTGAANFLFLYSKQPDFDFFDDTIGTVTINYYPALTSNWILEVLVPALNCDQALLPLQNSRGQTLANYKDIYTFRSIKDLIKEFAYCEWTVDTRPKINIPFGEAICDSTGTKIIDCNTRPSAISMGFNVLYATSICPVADVLDWTQVLGNCIYKTFEGGITDPYSFRAEMLFIYTGIKDSASSRPNAQTGKLINRKVSEEIPNEEPPVPDIVTPIAKYPARPKTKKSDNNTSFYINPQGEGEIKRNTVLEYLGGKVGNIVKTIAEDKIDDFRSQLDQFFETNETLKKYGMDTIDVPKLYSTGINTGNYKYTTKFGKGVNYKFGK